MNDRQPINQLVRIPEDLINQIRDQNDIVEVVGELGVHLKAAGQDFKGLCPFHNEKTASFTVSRNRQMFYCFGCQEGGNVISFVQKLEGGTFVEIIEFLAERVGIALPTPDAETQRIQNQQRQLHDLNQLAINFFHQNLMTPRVGGRALAYLKQRGISNKTIKEFQLGFVPAGYRQFIQYADQKGFNQQQLIKAGLAKENYRGLTDRFQNRIIFPILDERNRPVAFGGRGMTTDVRPKYLNSANTSIYDKSKVLYNLQNARKSINHTGTAILVEGYFDAITLYCAGLTNVVASLGTAFSQGHARLLKRFSDEVLIIYDGDSAGIRAATRGLNVLMKAGLQVKIALLPEGEDPDSLVRNSGIEAIKTHLDGSLNLIEFQIQRAVEQGAIHRIEIKSKAVQDIAMTLANLDSPLELNSYVKQVSHELELEPLVVYQELERLGVKSVVKRRSIDKHSELVKKKVSARESIERQFLESLILAPNLIAKAKKSFSVQDLQNETYAKIGAILYESESIEVNKLVENCDDEGRALISEILLTDQTPPNLEARMIGCIRRLNQFMLLDLEKQVRSSALVKGQDNTKILDELVQLSNRRRSVSKQNHS